MKAIQVPYPKLKRLLGPDSKIPEPFLEEQLNRPGKGLYLASCVQNQYLFVSEPFEAITGYSPSILLGHGIDCWINLLHQDDLEGTIDRMVRECIVETYQDGTPAPRPFNIEYRLRHASGNWIWVRDTKCIVSFDPDGNIDKVLGSMEDITAERQQRAVDLEKSLERRKPSGAIFNAWRQVKGAKHGHASDGAKLIGLSPVANSSFMISRSGSDEAPALTRREKEILALIGQGLSTKELADQLYISPHTVETHRRHLIEKFQVRNSVELVMKASRTFLI